MLVYFSLQLFELLNLLSTSTLIHIHYPPPVSPQNIAFFFYRCSHEAVYQKVPSPSAYPGQSVMPIPRTRSHIAELFPQQKPCPLSHCPTQNSTTPFPDTLLRPDTLRNNKTLSDTASDWAINQLPNTVHTER